MARTGTGRRLGHRRWSVVVAGSLIATLATGVLPGPRATSPAEAAPAAGWSAGVESWVTDLRGTA